MKTLYQCAVCERLFEDADECREHEATCGWQWRAEWRWMTPPDNGTTATGATDTDCAH